MKTQRQEISPPSLGEKILKRLLSAEESCSISGDYLELYSEIIATQGKFRADIWYWSQILRAVWTTATIALYWSAAMLKNYIKIGTRNLFRTRVFSFINVTGLAIGIAGTFMILVYVANELNYENFHRNRKRIYRASVEFGDKNNSMHFAGAMPALAPALLDTAPEVENAVRFFRDEKAKIKYAGNEFWEYEFYFADPSVFDVFTFPLIAGNKAGILDDPFSVVITKSIAQKYFGDEDPLGKTLLYNSEHPFKVTGTLKNIPANTHLRCDFLASMATMESLGRMPEKSWNLFGDTYTYLLVKPDTSLPGLLTKIRQLLETNTNQDFAKMLSFELLGLTDIHMKSKAIFDLAPKGNLTYVYVFFAVAILVLLIACFNFINLSTARSLKRIKEVGMRKVLGAGRSQIVRQFLGESMMITLAAVGAALLLFRLVYPLFNGFLENSLTTSQQNFNYLLILVPLVVIVVGVLAGSYPAFFLSRYTPIHALSKQNQPSTGRSLFRRILVVTQFALAIVLMIGTALILSQLDFMKNSDLGFDKKNVLLVQFDSRNPSYDGQYSVLVDRFKQNPQVESVAGAYTVPGRMSKFTMTIQRKSGNQIQNLSIHTVPVDFEYLESVGAELVEGRTFSREITEDEKNSILINQAAVKAFALSDPLGEAFSIPSPDGMREVRVIGVVKDFHVYSLKQKIEPLLLHIDPRHFFTVAIRIQPENTRATVESLKAAWESLFPGNPFEYTFLEDSYNRMYISEEKVGHLLAVFSGLAVFVACLGLFGLTSYMTEQRRKEIGIRKVMGADVSRILLLLSRDITRSVLLANLFAWPAAWLIARRWLQDYAYRVAIGWWMFILAAGLALAIAWFTVSFQAMRAARTNPVDSLRYE